MGSESDPTSYGVYQGPTSWHGEPSTRDAGRFRERVSMSILEEIQELPSGASFLRADLHIHSFGGSHDVTDVTMTPEAIVETAVAEGLHLISVTDHNSIGNIAAAMEAANQAALTLIPGVELSTPEGHLLAYFRDAENLDRFFARLDIADAGSPESRCQTSMRNCLGLIGECGGFGIAAHVDGSGGLEHQSPGGSHHKADIIAHPSLLAIELKNANSEIHYSPLDKDQRRVEIADRRRRELHLGERQHLARVLFSDSHTLDALGRNASGSRRLTRLKMDQPTFGGIEIALQDADARVRLEDDIPRTVPQVVGIKLDGGFLDESAIHLSPNLNCIIGGRGAGKSTAFEVIRCVAETDSQSSIVDCEAWPDTSYVVWKDEAGHVTTIVRRRDETNQNLEDAEFGTLTFHIACYGQSETAQTSAKAKGDPAVLLEYLDEFIGLADLFARDGQLRSDLLDNQSEIEEADRKVDQIPSYTRALSTTTRQLKALEQEKAAEVIGLQRKIAGERALREEIQADIDAMTADLEASPVLERLEALQDRTAEKEDCLGASEIEAIRDAADKLQADIEKVEASAGKSFTTFSTSVSGQLTAWKANEARIQSEIDEKRQRLREQGVKLDVAFINKLTADEAKHKKTLEALNRWKNHRTKLFRARKDLLKERSKVRGSISAKRVAYATRATAALGGTLRDLTVSVKFDTDAHSPSARSLIAEAMGWRTAQVPRASAITELLTVPKLLEAIRRNDAKPIQAIRDEQNQPVFAPAEARAILERLSEQPTRMALEACEISDLPRITVTKTVVDDLGTERRLTRGFANLSLGQQQSVLLSLMLSADSTAPLIIDQPEDNLDSEFIYHSLVPVLRQAKERRQVIVVTHNANIAVLGDAEQIVVLKSLSDRGMVMRRGSIDDPKTREFACQILEGSEEAFRRRAKIYGISD